MATRTYRTIRRRIESVGLKKKEDRESRRDNEKIKPEKKPFPFYQKKNFARAHIDPLDSTGGYFQRKCCEPRKDAK